VNQLKKGLVIDRNIFLIALIVLVSERI